MMLCIGSLSRQIITLRNTIPGYNTAQKRHRQILAKDRNKCSHIGRESRNPLSFVGGRDRGGGNEPRPAERSGCLKSDPNRLSLRLAGCSHKPDQDFADVKWIEPTTLAEGHVNAATSGEGACYSTTTEISN